MKKVVNTCLMLALGAMIASCGGEKESKKAFEVSDSARSEVNSESPASSGGAWVESVDVSGAIDDAMVSAGKDVFDKNCTACHKIGKKFIGPDPTGVMERRDPVWVMNMILDPERMVKEDPIAKELLMEYNGAPMANQNLSEEEARSVLEYFRTL